MTSRPYTVLYTQSPHDNPTDGVLEVEATCIADAYERAIKDRGVPSGDIDGIVLTATLREIGT